MTRGAQHWPVLLKYNDLQCAVPAAWSSVPLARLGSVRFRNLASVRFLERDVVVEIAALVAASTDQRGLTLTGRPERAEID